MQSEDALAVHHLQAVSAINNLAFLPCALWPLVAVIAGNVGDFGNATGVVLNINRMQDAPLINTNDDVDDGLASLSESLRSTFVLRQSLRVGNCA